MAVRFGVAVLLFAGIIRSGFSQAISFNTPLPWVSLRNDTIIVRAQIDTAAFKNKQLSLTLATIKNGKTSTIASKVFPVKDPSGEFSFGKIKKKLVGGEEFLRVKWAVKGSEDKGSVEPIGIADLSVQTETDTVRAVHVADNMAIKDAAAAVGEKFSQTGKMAYSFAWNKNALFAVHKKGAGKDTLKFAFDGKSGKNAFLSYPDRFVVSTVSDSIIVKGVHYKRDIKKDSLVYTSEEWRNEMTHEVVGDKIVVRIPWFDTGMIPFEERTIGFGAFVVGAKGKTVAALPASAQVFIPATWGVMLLQK
ncbi:MAG: hypothetical protein JW913_05725 [Chitinispirillaceae bacterium]|nr:hypothetical protein [Chitinispirillaceae bacterium]